MTDHNLEQQAEIERRGLTLIDIASRAESQVEDLLDVVRRKVNRRLEDYAPKGDFESPAVINVKRACLEFIPKPRGIREAVERRIVSEYSQAGWTIQPKTKIQYNPKPYTSWRWDSTGIYEFYTPFKYVELAKTKK